MCTHRTQQIWELHSTFNKLGVKEQFEIEIWVLAANINILELSVQLWCVVGGTLEVFTYFSILWNCIMILECWSAWCSYLAREVWSHYRGEADYFVVMTKSTAITHWRTCNLFANLAEMTWKAQSVCWKRILKRLVGLVTPGAIYVAKPCVCVYSIYIYEYNLSVVKVHVYSFVNM